MIKSFVYYNAPVAAKRSI